MIASRERPISFFVDSGGSLRACGVELHRNEGTESFLDDNQAAYAGSLGFGRSSRGDSDTAYLRKEEPTLMPAAEGVRMRSMAIGEIHGLALTDEGQVYRWEAYEWEAYKDGGLCRTSRSPEVLTVLEAIRELRMRCNSRA
jgi:alpha-tubulin suppressor-like RCC1 family protein